MTSGRDPGGGGHLGRGEGEAWIEVSAGLIFRDGRLLITRRPVGSHLAGLWEFPGGKLEPGETWEQSLRRELREELGVEVVVGGLFEELRHRYPDKSVWLRFYRCRLETGSPRALGCAEIAWVDRGMLRRFEFPEADAVLLGRLETDAGIWVADDVNRSAERRSRE